MLDFFFGRSGLPSAFSAAFGAASAFDRVVAVAGRPVEDVVAGAEVGSVVAAAADDMVVAVAAEENIRPLAAEPFLRQSRSGRTEEIPGDTVEYVRIFCPLCEYRSVRCHEIFS